MFFSCWSVYGLRKVILGKKVPILSGKTPNHSKVFFLKLSFLISRLHLMYKCVILNITRKQNIFFGIFRNINLVLVTLITWLLKPKCILMYIFQLFLYENMI